MLELDSHTSKNFAQTSYEGIFILKITIWWEKSILRNFHKTNQKTQIL